jgi:TPR repeat protein
VMYDKGQGVEQDFKEAVKWYQKAADQGDVDAQFNLGVMYAEGEGVEQDYVTAYTWYNIAAAKGDTQAATWKDNTAKQLTPDQIAKAEELVKEMIKKNPKLMQ